MVKLDKKDLKIVELLEENSRISNVKISKIIGVSEAAVRKKIKKLEKLGIIRKYTVDVDYRKMGYVVSITGIDVAPEKMLDVIEKIKETVRKMFLCSGDHTFIAFIITKDTRELQEIHRKIEEIEGVRRICPAIVLEVVK